MSCGQNEAYYMSEFFLFISLYCHFAEFISSKTLLVEFLLLLLFLVLFRFGFCLLIMSSANKDSLTSSFFMHTPFIYFPDLISLTNVLYSILNDESR